MKPWLYLAAGLLALLIAISWLTSEPLRPGGGAGATSGGQAGLVPALPDEREDPKGRERKALPLQNTPPRLDRAHFEALAEARENGKARPAGTTTEPTQPAPAPPPAPAPAGSPAPAPAR
jgi:hypothetical protein